MELRCYRCYENKISISHTAISLFPQILIFAFAFFVPFGALNREQDVSPSALMPISHVGNWTRHKNFSGEMTRKEKEREKERDERNHRRGRRQENKTSERERRMIRPSRTKKRKKRSWNCRECQKKTTSRCGKREDGKGEHERTRSR